MQNYQQQKTYIKQKQSLNLTFKNSKFVKITENMWTLHKFGVFK